MVKESPTARSLERIRRFGIRPKRDYGQNFLMDANILDRIGTLAAVSPDDCVLEIGGGLGVLSEYLAQRARFLHVYEVDDALEPVLRGALADFPGVALHMADALRADLPSLRPAPNKIVANLPYSVAASIVVGTVVEMSGVKSWCVMVQREVADRLMAAPGGKDYGVPSAIVQTACSIEFAHAVSRTVFLPQPRVDSALVTMTRTRAFPGERLRLLISAAFAHRRKAAARSIATFRERDHLASLFGLEGADMRTAVLDALAAAGMRGDVRAERISPEGFVELDATLSVMGSPDVHSRRDQTQTTSDVRVGRP